MDETIAFRQGYMTSWGNGYNHDTPDIKWHQVAPGDIVRSASGSIVSVNPMRCENSTWPSRLHKVEVPPKAMAVNWNTGQVKATAVRIIEECDPTEILGPQKDQLLAMAAKLIELTRAQQLALYDAAGPLGSNHMANIVIREVAVDAGRHNTSAALNLMWHEHPDVWPRHAIGNAAVAVAHKDLLEQQGLWSLYGEVLYRPWRQVVQQQ